MSKVELLDSDIDRLLEADEEANAGDGLAIFARIQERRRKRQHTRLKAEQPAVGVRDSDCHDGLLEELRKFWRQPLSPDDRAALPGEMDNLLLTVSDTLDAGDVEDVIFAALRVARKAWAWNMAHLGPIEGLTLPADSK